MNRPENGPFRDGAAFAEATGSRRALPPIHDWNPPFHGNFDMRIDAQGRWYYRDTPILRDRMVQLFSTILRREDDDRYYLVTPVEKVGVIVEDVPFQAVEMSVSSGDDDRRISFRTNVGDVVEAGPDHPLRFAEEAATGGLVPYVLVRDRLEARVIRALAYDLVDLAEEEVTGGRTMFVVRSGGERFVLPMPEEAEPGPC